MDGSVELPVVKTGVTRQPELVRLLADLLPPPSYISNIRPSKGRLYHKRMTRRPVRSGKEEQGFVRC